MRLNGHELTPAQRRVVDAVANGELVRDTETAWDLMRMHILEPPRSDASSMFVSPLTSRPPYRMPPEILAGYMAQQAGEELREAPQSELERQRKPTVLEIYEEFRHVRGCIALVAGDPFEKLGYMFAQYLDQEENDV